MADDSETSVQPRAEQSRRPRGTPPSGEWLFEKGGQVFGPVAAPEIVALLSSGTLHPTTRMRRDGEEPWRPLQAIPALRGAVDEWEARTRREREERAARGRARRGTLARWTGVALAAGTVIAIVVGVAGYLALRRPWERRNALLDGFQVEVTVGAARVARGDARAADGEIAVPADAGRKEAREREAHPATRRGVVADRRAGTAAPADGAAGANGAPAHGSVTGGGLVAAEYDSARIEQVVARSKETLAPCVRDEARRSPDLTGDIPIEFAIGNDGKVVALWIQDPRLRSGPLHECLLGALRRWTFDPFAGQRPVVALSFHLAPR